MKFKFLRTSRVGKAFLRCYKRVAVPVYKRLAAMSRKIAAHEHKMLFLSEWCVDNPENMDHYIDQYYLWEKLGTSHWLERGVYNTLALQMFEKPYVLELCCGEGWMTKRFYASVAEKIVACDFDQDAISEAKRKNQVENIRYRVADIRDGIPASIKGNGITNVIWDTAIEHFTETEIEGIMRQIKTVLAKEKGIVSGHTICEREEGKSLEQHEYEFKNTNDLKRFFTPYFKNVIVFETVYPDRHNLYFWASDGELPFRGEWKHWVHS